MRDCTTGNLCLVDTAPGLERLVRFLESVTAAGVDLEADSMFHFHEKVCLIQICANDACFLVDPLRIDDLSPLKPFFADPSIKKVFHGADYDIRSLHRDFGITVANLYDCELACRFLGEKATGLDTAVAKRFGVTLDKRYQKKDWSVRPLPAPMLEYAAEDVRYLVRLSAMLEKELEEKGRDSWVKEECDALSTVRCAPKTGAPMFMNFKGAGRLGRRSLAALEELLQARNDLARSMDRPPFKVFSNDRLLRIAAERPKSKKKLQKMGVFSAKQIARYGDAVLDAVKRAESIDKENLPVYPRPKRKSPPHAVSLRISKLGKWRSRKADDLGLDPGVFFPKHLVVAVAMERPGTLEALGSIEGMRQWRTREFGSEILELLERVG